VPNHRGRITPRVAFDGANNRHVMADPGMIRCDGAFFTEQLSPSACCLLYDRIDIQKAALQLSNRTLYTILYCLSIEYYF
jgi:hypothetical protein